MLEKYSVPRLSGDHFLARCALAYAGLASAYFYLSNLFMPPREAMPRVREAAERALALDDSLAQAHTCMALALVWYDWNFAQGEKEFQRAIALNPKDTTSICMVGYALQKLGRTNEASQYYAKALKIKPGDEMARKLMASVDMND